MSCPYLEYRNEDGDQAFDHERPYCAIQEAFVSPMQADICNDRFDFYHAEDCAVYRAHVEPEVSPTVGEADRKDVVAESGDSVTD